MVYKAYSPFPSAETEINSYSGLVATPQRIFKSVFPTTEKIQHGYVGTASQIKNLLILKQEKPPTSNLSLSSMHRKRQIKNQNFFKHAF